MELNPEHFYAIAFYNFPRGLTQQECIGELNSGVGGEATSGISLGYGAFESRDRRSL